MTPEPTVFMRCLQCGTWFNSEDEGHQFCREACAAAWDADPGLPNNVLAWRVARRQAALRMRVKEERRAGQAARRH